VLHTSTAELKDNAVVFKQQLLLFGNVESFGVCAVVGVDIVQRCMWHTLNRFYESFVAARGRYIWMA
jgi:hypothetical protein